MATSKFKVQITDQYIYGGKIYHPGPTGVGIVSTDDQAVYDALTAAEARRKSASGVPNSGSVLHTAESVGIAPLPPTAVMGESPADLAAKADADTKAKAAVEAKRVADAKAAEDAKNKAK